MKKKNPQQNQIDFWRTHISPPRQILDQNKKILQNQYKTKYHLFRNHPSQYKTLHHSPLISRKQQISSKILKSSRIQQYTEDNRPSQYQQSTSSLPIQLIQNNNTPISQRYRNQKPIYLRFNNFDSNSKYRKKFFSSLFFNIENQKKRYEKPIFKDFQQGKIDKLQIRDHQKFKFDSQFQSGNLFAVYQIQNNQFDLILQNDTNSRGNNQWFYFSIQNQTKNTTIKLNIINFYKSHSLYCQGMKPLAYSILANKNPNGPGWSRYGTNIKYYNSDIKIQNSDNRYYYTLSFQYKFDYDSDLVYFSNCYPYTISHLSSFLQEVKKYDQFVIIKNIGTTLLKNNIYMIMIGEDIKQKQKKYRLNLNYFDQKHSIIIMARQHPGQTPGSFVCEGFVKALLTQNIQAKFILSKFNIFIFPMINVDGVINGNYRGNAYGYDLNRVWKNQKIQRHPQIFYIKNQIRKIGNRSNVGLIIDFHGHSKKLNSFFFGNNDEKNPEKSRMLPLIASKMTSFISFKDSTFTQETEKDSTARISLKYLLSSHKQCQIYTFQTSFYGYIKNNRKIHFTVQDLKNLGGFVFSAIYKKQSEQTKQIKNLKQSPILRQVRKQLGKIIQQLIPNDRKQSNRSDSEVQKEILEQQQLEFNLSKNQQIQSSGRLETIKQKNQKSIIRMRKEKKRRSNLKQVRDFEVQTQFQKSNEEYMELFSQNARIQAVKQQIQRRNANSIKPIYTMNQKQNYKQYLLEKISVIGQIYQQNLHDLSPVKSNHKYIQTQFSYLKAFSFKSTSNKLLKKTKINDFHFKNLSIVQNNKKKQLQKLNSSRLDKFDITGYDTINQLIQIRKINGRIKNKSKSFRQQYMIQPDMKSLKIISFN